MDNELERADLPAEAQDGATTALPGNSAALDVGADSADTGRPTVQILDDFELRRQIGEGSAGVVYKARQISTERTVALKVLAPAMAAQPKCLQRFYREARITTRLAHPNIVVGYGVGEADGQHYFAMEYVSGIRLHDVRTLLAPLDVADSVYIVLGIARGLEFAHGLGLVHRDIKASNILIRKDGVVKITDLGMIKVLMDDVSMTRTGYGVGTPSYMPLEQARNNKQVDGRCDIYALGCLLYSLLTGQMPFRGDNLVALILAKEAGKFVPAGQLNPQVPERLDEILTRMLAKLPDDRYSSCTALIGDLLALDLPECLSFVPSKKGLLAAVRARAQAVEPAVGACSVHVIRPPVGKEVDTPSARPVQSSNAPRAADKVNAGASRLLRALAFALVGLSLVAVLYLLLQLFSG